MERYVCQFIFLPSFFPSSSSSYYCPSTLSFFLVSFLLSLDWSLLMIQIVGIAKMSSTSKNKLISPKAKISVSLLSSSLLFSPLFSSSLLFSSLLISIFPHLSSPLIFSLLYAPVHLSYHLHLCFHALSPWLTRCSRRCPHPSRSLLHRYSWPSIWWTGYEYGLLHWFTSSHASSWFISFQPSNSTFIAFFLSFFLPPSSFSFIAVRVWAFGHTHWSCDRLVNQTRVGTNQLLLPSLLFSLLHLHFFSVSVWWTVSNQLGYIEHERRNPGYRPECVVEVCAFPEDKLYSPSRLSKDTESYLDDPMETY